MNVKDIMEALATRLRDIDGLRVHGHPVEKIDPPTAVVSYPQTYTYDATYGRGNDDMMIPIVVAVGRPADALRVRDQLTIYMDGSGPASVKATLEAEPLPDGIDALRVVGVEVSPISVAGIDYIAAVFDVQVSGRGTA